MDLNLPPIEITSDEQFLQHHTLPPLPGIVSKLQEIIQSDDINISEISRLVQSDVALVAQILKIVNSAYFGLKREVSDLKIAIAFLGINEIHRIVLSLSVINALGEEDQSILKAYWYHSYYTAIIARVLASRYARLLDPEEIWAAALLHDIGSLFYLKFYPKHFKAIHIVANKRGVLANEAEALLKFPPSSQFGSILCTFWKLPQNVKMACEYHTLDKLDNLRRDDPHLDFKKIITLASTCASFTVEELSAKCKDKIAMQLMTHLELDNDAFLLLMGEIRDLQKDVDAFVDTLF